MHVYPLHVHFRICKHRYMLLHGHFCIQDLVYFQYFLSITALLSRLKSTPQQCSYSGKNIIHLPECWQAWPWEANLCTALGLCPQQVPCFSGPVPTLFHCNLVGVLLQASHSLTHLTPPAEASAAN